MKTDILIVSHARDFRYLKFALRSIAKFATGFNHVNIVVPETDVGTLYQVAGFEHADHPDWKVHTIDQWPGKGMVHHMYVIMTAPDYCREGEYILHMDSDCVFQEPVTPEDYFHEGKPVLAYATFEWLVAQQHNIRNWQVAVENALGVPVLVETMRRHPAVHGRGLYHRARELIEAATHQPLADYMRQQRNEFPQTFAEFPTLGAVAWQHFYNSYHWINQQIEPLPPNKMLQFWSHREPVAEEVAILDKLGLL